MVSRGPRRAATSRSGNGQGGKVLGGLLLVGLAIGGGCSRQIPVHPVSGRVTLDGKPLVDAQISFRPANGPEAFGVLDGDGRYTLSTRAAGDGAVAGKHAVTLSPLTEGLILTPDADPRLPAPTPGAMPVPAKYLQAETSGLEATVVPGENVFDFDLTAR
jgi:hypothetical protein